MTAGFSWRTRGVRAVQAGIRVKLRHCGPSTVHGIGRHSRARKVAETRRVEGERAAVTLSIRRIDCASDDAERAIAALRAELSPTGNVVTPEGRARTIAAFGEPLEPRQVVERICDDVAARGLDAVLDYGRRLDGAELEPGQIRIAPRNWRTPTVRPIPPTSRPSTGSARTSWRISGRSSITTCGWDEGAAFRWVCFTARCGGSASAYPAGPPPIRRAC